MRKIFLFIIPAIILGCNHSPVINQRDDFKQFFDNYEVNGSFLLFDIQTSTYTSYNYSRCKKSFLPASTFKILNSLIGLETGIILNENHVIPWDSITKQIPSWNQNHTILSAFQNSVVPWYQELARNIGVKKNEILDKKS